MINSKEELPKDWMVKITEENIKILYEYRYKHYGKYRGLEEYIFMCHYGSGHDGGCGYEEITFKEFKKYVLGIQEEQFPEDDFGVVIENNNGREIIEYLISKGFKNTASLKGSMFDGRYSILKGMNCITSNPNPVSKIYTLQQLKQLENNMETKKILTYKLVREEYADACIKITEFDGTPKTFMEYRLAVDGNFVAKLRTAGVLDLWFEPVYEKQERVINMGSFNLTIKPKGIFHSNENITDFVKTIYQQYAGFDKLYKFGKYDFKQKDIILSKTGCENSETKLSQWLAVWEEYVKKKRYEI